MQLCCRRLYLPAKVNRSFRSLSLILTIVIQISFEVFLRTPRITDSQLVLSLIPLVILMQFLGERLCVVLLWQLKILWIQQSVWFCLLFCLQYSMPSKCNLKQWSRSLWSIRFIQFSNVVGQLPSSRNNSSNRVDFGINFSSRVNDTTISRERFVRKQCDLQFSRQCNGFRGSGNT